MVDRAKAELALTAPFSHLESKNHERLARVLCSQIPEVFRLNRIIEQRTGYSSEIGKNMLVDVLAHLGTLASRQDLSQEQQATQLSKIEEHLRRAIIEHPEEVLRDRLSDVRELWAEYEREAYSYRKAGLLRGVPRHQDLEDTRKRIDALMESARSSKPDETSWERSLTAAAEMTEAASLASGLADKLEASIGQARRITEQKARDVSDDQRDATATKRDHKATLLWAVAILVALVLFFIGGVLVGHTSRSKQRAQATVTDSRPGNKP
jgi:hypothetical protein